jgi:putative hemolysin
LDPERSIELLGVVICLALAAVSSAADAALTMISRHRLHTMLAEKRSRAQAAARLLDDPARFKAATLTLNISAAVVGTALLLAFLRPWTAWWQPVLGTLGLLLALLVFGEALPKILASMYPERTALLLARPVQAFAYLLLPFTGIVNLLMRPFVSRTNAAITHGNALVSEEELKLLVNVGAEEGLFEKDEREMIEGILIFGDTLVREVMVPRVDIQALESGATVASAIDLAVATGHSRIPVYRETIDTITGVLYVRDMLPLLRVGELHHPVGDLTRAVYFVPETMKGDDLLRSLKARKVHMAVVVDE